MLKTTEALFVFFFFDQCERVGSVGNSQKFFSSQFEFNINQRLMDILLQIDSKLIGIVFFSSPPRNNSENINCRILLSFLCRKLSTQISLTPANKTLQIDGIFFNFIADDFLDFLNFLTNLRTVLVFFTFDKT